MIATTPFELEIVRRVQAGELCARVLDHGDYCGRDLDETHRVGMCLWHSEEFLNLPHTGEAGESTEHDPHGKNCTRCGKRPVAYRHSRLCGNCQKVTRRSHLVANLRRETK